MKDNLQMAIETAMIIKNSTVLITPEVVAEVVYNMRGRYEMERHIVAEGITNFLDIDNVTSNHMEVIVKSLEYYAETKLDFVDCILAAYSMVMGYEVCTFDKKLNKFIEKNRF